MTFHGFALSCVFSVFAAASFGATLPRDARYGHLPLHFEPNAGQADANVRFLSRGSGYALFLTQSETVAVLRNQSAHASVVRLRFVGANGHASITGEHRTGGVTNDFRGNDPRRWYPGIPHFERVRMSGVYDGIDVVYYGTEGGVEYDFVVAPGSDPGRIAMRFDGATQIDVDAGGDLVLHLDGGVIRQQRPVAYQERAGVRHAVAARYRQDTPRQFAIELGAYDRTLPLIIDPVLAWSTYLGGTGSDQAFSIAVDGTGSTYVTGLTASANFPTANALQATLAGSADAFVAKLNPAGTAFVYSTYLGGSGTDIGRGIAVDADGNAYVTGQTFSIDFPTANAVQAAFGGTSDAFLVKLNAAGSALVYATYLGGTLDDDGQSVALDAARNAYVAGTTHSANYPTANAIQAVNAGPPDAFLTKVNAAGSALVYSTYIGGSGGDFGYGVAVDGGGAAYVAGVTQSANFPVANAIQAALAGTEDAFVLKVNAAGTAFVYSTYLGGSAADGARAVALDGTGSAYVAGYTSSTNFPTANAVQGANAGAQDAFVTKINPAGSALVYSTYLGGSASEVANGIAVDSAGRAHVTGGTNSTNFPTAAPVQAYGGTEDVFVTKFNAAGTALVYSTYLGGSLTERGHAVAVGSAGDAYLAGQTSSTDFPTANPLQASQAGAGDAFVAKLVDSADLAIAKAADGPFVAGQNSTFQITVTNTGATAALDVVVTDALPAGVTLVSATPSQGSCPGTSPVTCNLGTVAGGSSATISLVVVPASPGPLSNTATVTTGSADPNAANDSSTVLVQVGENADLSIVKTAAGPFTANQNGSYSISVTNNGPTAASAVTVTDILPAGVTLISATPTQGTCSGTTTVTCSLGTLNNGASASIALVVRPSAPGPLSNTATVDSPAADPAAGNNASTAVVTVAPAPAVPAVPALDGRTLLLLAGFLAAMGMWMAAKVR
ncbi:MAG TPA: SBBP repeat-containing protein [Thermoanaerobaculia bacterium]